MKKKIKNQKNQEDKKIVRATPDIHLTSIQKIQLKSYKKKLQQSWVNL